MRKLKILVKKTRFNKIQKIVKEVYLRTDIPCGITECKSCHNLKDVITFENQNETDSKQIYILDDSFLCKEMDLIENFELLQNVICLQTSLNILKTNSSKKYERMEELLKGYRGFYLFSNEHHAETYVEQKTGVSEYPEERIIDLILKASEYYSAHLSPLGINVTLLVADSQCRNKYLKKLGNTEGQLGIITTEDYITQNSGRFPDLIEYIAYETSAQLARSAGNVSHSEECKMTDISTQYFTPHHSISDINLLLRKGELFTGKLIISRSDPLQGSVKTRGLEEEIYIIGRENMNRSMHLDLVGIKVLPEREWVRRERICNENELEKEGESLIGREGASEDIPPVDSVNQLRAKITLSSLKPTGQVLGILHRHERAFCGSIIKENIELLGGGIHRCLFAPYDIRFPSILINTRKVEALKEKRIVVKIDQWEAESLNPQGHFVRVIGEEGSVDVESEVILEEHNVEIRPFTKSVLDCLPSPGWSIPSTEIDKRIDLRDVLVCSIDPPGCKDIDDALHCRALQNGNLEVGVHIADVTYFVKPGTELDREAARRCTTVYLVDRRTDMLPQVLTEQLCSLVQGVDRCSFSVIWEIHPHTHQILSTVFSKSLIRSTASLTYYEAQAIIDTASDTTPLAKSLRSLMAIARTFRQHRITNGGLTLASPEVKFSFDAQTHNPTDVGLYQMVETNQLVEEFMLLANVSVAKQILGTYPAYSLLRRHPPPKSKELSELSNLLEPQGFKLEHRTSKELSGSLDLSCRKEDPYFNKLVRIMCTRTMNQALYFCTSECEEDDYFHYGLATPYYTHFTSPIRRYADVLVHRLLAASIDLYSLPNFMTDRAKVSRQCLHMNRKNRQAQYASRASNQFHHFLYFKEKRITEDSLVMNCTSSALYVIVPKYGIEGNLLLYEGINYEFDTLLLGGRIGGKLHQPFDHLDVDIRIHPNPSNKCIALYYSKTNLSD